MALIFLGVPSF